MRTVRVTLQAALACVCLCASTFKPRVALAHCDGLDGPVVTAAQKALAAKNVDLVLVWVQPEDEPEIRRAFAHALAVRGLSHEAQELADTFFFETLVRVHRAGEGAPYTGLAPAGRDLGPAIPLADQALSTGTLAPLVEAITHATHAGLVERFEAARKAQAAATSVTTGREYVHAYVEFIHYAERAYEAATQRAAHAPTAPETSGHESGHEH